ncbi:hypothetical protein KBZ10_02955 [Streptomyces sp. F63]|uniref:hypothetical protein n=1 Tax=Streptomyces sp. F63 TaxID=2824887 RepID=UPI001B3862AD|nr:hypothetical protein [Streptomyces sp. F63]MBQ0983508.1 hypothetical protein [Streptomyces sp. F63]
MTTSHSTVTEPWGKRAERTSGAAVRMTEAGRFAIPLRISHGDGTEAEDLELVVTAEEALRLCAEVGALLVGAADAP